MSEVIVVGPMPPEAERRPSAEILVHPMMHVRYAQEKARQYADITVELNRHRLLKDSVKQYRKRLEQMGVKPERVTWDVVALEALLLRPPLKRRSA